MPIRVECKTLINYPPVNEHGHGYPHALVRQNFYTWWILCSYLSAELLEDICPKTLKVPEHCNAPKFLQVKYPIFVRCICRCIWLLKYPHSANLMSVLVHNHRSWVSPPVGFYPQVPSVHCDTWDIQYPLAPIIMWESLSLSLSRAILCGNIYVNIYIYIYIYIYVCKYVYIYIQYI